MNNDFLAEMFSSVSFREDYTSFLPHLEETLSLDKNRKAEKLITHIIELINKNKLEVRRIF